MAVSGLEMPPDQNLFQSWSILLFSSGCFAAWVDFLRSYCSPSGRQALGQLQDFVDLRRAEHATYALRVNHREGRVDQVFLLDLLALDDEVLQQVQEFQLAAGEVAVPPDELVKGVADRFREALQDLDAEDVADKLDETGLAVLVGLAQQVFGDVRVCSAWSSSASSRASLGETSSPFLSFCRMGLCAVSSAIMASTISR
jgi:hypothetical protein